MSLYRVLGPNEEFTAMFSGDLKLYWQKQGEGEGGKRTEGMELQCSLTMQCKGDRFL